MDKDQFDTFILLKYGKIEITKDYLITLPDEVIERTFAAATNFSLISGTKVQMVAIFVVYKNEGLFEDIYLANLFRQELSRYESRNIDTD